MRIGNQGKGQKIKFQTKNYYLLKLTIIILKCNIFSLGPACVLALTRIIRQSVRTKYIVIRPNMQCICKTRLRKSYKIKLVSIEEVSVNVLYIDRRPSKGLIQTENLHKLLFRSKTLKRHSIEKLLSQCLLYTENL